MLNAKALPGNPYDGPTLRDVIEGIQKLTGCEIERSYVDARLRALLRRLFLITIARLFISDQRSIQLINGRLSNSAVARGWISSVGLISKLGRVHGKKDLSL